MSDIINIGSRRELFWDEFLINTAETTAKLKLHHLEAREVVIDHDAPWEGDGCDFHNIIQDDNLYRMYYLGCEILSQNKESVKPRVIGYAESTDGKNG